LVCRERRDDIRWFLQGAGPDNTGTAQNQQAGINVNPFNDSMTGFLYALTNVTGTGALASGFNVYSVLGNYKRPTLAVASTAASIISTSTETTTTLFTGTPAATTVDKAFDYSKFGIGYRRGEKVVVRVADAAMTNSVLQAVGRFVKRNK
jgi:hypothetical protein